MKTEYEKCMAGEPFIGSRDPKIVEMILRTKRLLAQFNATDYADSKRRRELLCEMLGHVGKNVHVDIDFHCECGKHIFMGATHSTKVDERMVQDCPEEQEICRTYALPVRIEDGVWIGGGVVILPGVTIGRNSVIGAGSVVTRSIPANCVAVGNPCRVIKQIDNIVSV